MSAAFYLYDDARARSFQPFAQSRPVGELRAGAELIRRRWEIALGAPCAGFIGAPHLSDFDEAGGASAVSGGELPSGSIVVNSRCAPALAKAVQADLWRCGQQIAAVRLLAARPVAAFADGQLDLSALPMPTARLAELRGWWLDDVWDVIRHLTPMLADDVNAIAPNVERATRSPATIIGEHDVVIEAGAHVEPMVLLDATAGPILIRRGSSVAAFTRLTGPAAIGFDVQVLGGKISGVSIGDACRVHGEMSATVMIGHSNKGHEGFVGHSMLGRWVNIGASTVTSNLKNTYGTVQLWTPEGLRETGMQFLGTLFGDHAKTGVGTRLTTGCVVGVGANVVLSGVAPKYVPPFAWGGSGATYDLVRFVQAAERMMSRRHVTLSERQRRLLANVYAACLPVGA